MAGEAPTEEERNQAEMARFVGGTTLDGEPSDGEATEDENTHLRAEEEAAAAATATAAANEAKRVADEAAAVALAAKGVKTPPADETAEQKATREAAEAAEAKKSGKTVQQRIDEKTKAQRTAERERDAALARVTELEAAQGIKKPLTPAAATTTPGLVPPDPKDFEYGELDTKYVSALARYEVKMELAADAQAKATVRDTEAKAAAVADFQVRVDNFAEAGAKKFADFNDLVIEGAKAGDWDLPATVGELILDSDYGHEIAHYLASTPDEAARIAKLPPSAQAAKFGRLEAKFEAEAAATTSAQTTQAVKTSKAPAPLKTPRSNAGTFSVDGSTKDFAAFEALAKAATQ